VQALTTALFSLCLRTSSFSSAWKSSIIVPLVKDALKERSMSNIRPISLQSYHDKLFNRILARRLAVIIARYPILNIAQRGFITGGTTIKCVDELLDAWNVSRMSKCEQYTLLYDIKQAYDSVQFDVLTQSLRRLGMPAGFVGLIADSLTDLTSCVRTEYGLTESFSVERSLRQGDPLAPLLFACLGDGLHDSLDVHPVTNIRHGCVIISRGMMTYLALLGYADDTAVLASTLAALCEQNDWVKYFLLFNHMRLSSPKCELVGRGPDGQPVQAAAVAAAGITINAVVVVPRPHDAPIRYLGVHSCFDGNCSAQQRKSLDMVMLFTRVVRKFKPSIGRAVYMFNVFLLPKLELALHYVHGRGTNKWVMNLDRLLIDSIKHAVKSPLMLSHSAVALAVGLTLPSWLETSAKVSEMFLRMNSSDSRWSSLGRMLMREQCPASIDSVTFNARTSAGLRLQQAAKLAVTHVS
jgi:hypothetical protein